MKKNRLATAVALIGAAQASLMLPTLAIAQEESQPDADTELVFVTGSRIPTTVSDAPRPVTVLSSQNLEIQGITDVSSALRDLPFNNLGSFRDVSGSSFGQVALIDLKGLGADRTAVLINGRRIGGNPLTGDSAVDINTIPFSAVDRIEILTDSASSIYGADAIGGVVNIIMKEDFNGFSMSVGHDSPERDNALTDRFDMTFGASGDKGSVLVSLDYNKRNPVFDKDRAYSRVSVTPRTDGLDPIHTVDTIGVSSGGNTGFSTDFSDAFRVGDCPTDLYIPVSNPEGIPGAVGCGYGYADISMLTGGLERTSLYINADYEIADNLEVYSQNRVTKSDTFGRYAPAVGFFAVDADAPLNPIGEEFFLFHRFVGHGNRNDNIGITELDNLLGLKGEIFDSGVNFDFFARRYVYDAVSEGDTYIVTSIIEDLVADGSYDFINPLDPDNADAILQSSATLTRDISTEYRNVGATFDGSFGELAGGDIGWAAGVEWAREEYQDQYDNFREAGNVLGSSGNSSDGSRERHAVFAEFSLPVLDDLTVNAAGRYDSYNDFGEEFSPSISVKWDPLDMLGLRASWGEGFKAPNLGDIGQELSQSFESVIDTTFCEPRGIAAEDCVSTQVDELTGGNPDLRAELSESYNFGVILKPTDSLSFSLDYWSVSIEDAVETLDLSDVLNLEQQGALPPGVIINRGASDANGNPGIITRCAGALQPPNCGIINVFANLATKDVTGLDLRLDYGFSAGDVGDFNFMVNLSHYLEYDEQPTPLSEVFDRPGTSDYPETQVTSQLVWTISDFAVSYSYKWIDAHKGGTAGEDYAAWDKHDINATWNLDPFTLAFGVRNLTDEDPSVSRVSGWNQDTSETSTYLYDVAGRTYTFTVGVDF